MAEFAARHNQCEGANEEIDDLGFNRTKNQQRIQCRQVLALGNYKTLTFNAIVC
jgi:hypothetical protein